MFKAASISLLLGLFSTSAFAAGYGSAGCGLGSMAFGSKGGFTQVFASTTNGTFGSQTFGITSGTSNCGGGGKSITMFIDTNKPSLKNDIARGHGETLDALASLYSCESSSAFNSTLKANYSTIFNSDETSAITSEVQKLSVACDV